MLSEKELIETCKKLIEKKFHLHQSEIWKERDFEYLSDLILQNTGTRISISTLKRIWKDGENRIPQVYTLNALARFSGFENWSDFKQQHSFHSPGAESPFKDKKKPGKIPKGIYFILTALVFFSLFFLFYVKQQRTVYKQSEIVFKSRKNVASGVPNTVVFEYDISKIDFDSAFIQHSWDKRLRARVSKDNRFQTFIYYYPGYHTAKLIIDDSVLKTEHVNISTPGWQAMVDGVSSDGLPLYIPGDSIFSNNQLYISKETLQRNRIPVENKTFWINYFNIGTIKEAIAENFTLETRLKNSLEDGALTCQYCQLSIICEQGMISIPFSNPGCVANIHLHIGDIIKNGRKNDLSAFGIDLSGWRNIKIRTIRKDMEVYADGKKIFHLKIAKDLGRITGFHYRFYGCGAVDMIKLYNEKNQLCFADDFSR